MRDGDIRFNTTSTPVRLILLLVVLISLVGIGLFQWRPWARLNQQPIIQPRETIAATAPLSDEQINTAVFESAMPSVVNVDTVVFRRGSDFRLQAVQAETGSGFIWDERGHIVTNYHVVSDAVSKPGQLALRIVFWDRSEYRASVVGVAPDVDLAVIRIDAPAEKLKKLSVGRSDGLKVGLNAYAIGNPFGLSGTMTKGIISALDRQIESPTGKPISGAIQTSAQINPGNSGGPLLNKDGLLIGVNTSIASPSGGNVGIGFAIPVDTVNPVVTELIAHGRTLQPDIGVRLYDQRKLRRAGFATGVMLAFVEPGGPAASAGLRGIVVNPRNGETSAGDLIRKWNSVEIQGNVDFDQALAREKPGNKVKLTLERDGRTLEVEVVVRGV